MTNFKRGAARHNNDQTRLIAEGQGRTTVEKGSTMDRGTSHEFGTEELSEVGRKDPKAADLRRGPRPGQKKSPKKPPPTKTRVELAPLALRAPPARHRRLVQSAAARHVEGCRFPSIVSRLECPVPELPEVETMCRGVAAIVGSRIVEIPAVRCAKKPILISPPLPQFRRRAVGRTRGRSRPGGQARDRVAGQRRRHRDRAPHDRPGAGDRSA